MKNFRTNRKQTNSVLKTVTISILILASFGTSYSQSWEIGGMAGASNYHGDLAFNVVPKESHFSGGVFFKYNINEYWAMRPTVSYLKISGADSNFNEYKIRNLSFRNNIYEVSNVMEFNFQPFSRRSVHNENTFYAMLGIAGYIHKPEAKMDGEWHDLRTAQTERVNYKLIQISVPFGVGFKQSFGDNLILGFEAGWRKTFTDYLDDVSTVYPELNTSTNGIKQFADRSWEVTEDNQPRSNAGDMRGDPNFKDWYFQTAFSLSYRFTPIKCAFNKINFFE